MSAECLPRTLYISGPKLTDLRSATVLKSCQLAEQAWRMPEYRNRLRHIGNLRLQFMPFGLESNYAIGGAFGLFPELTQPRLLLLESLQSVIDHCRLEDSPGQALPKLVFEPVFRISMPFPQAPRPLWDG